MRRVVCRRRPADGCRLLAAVCLAATGIAAGWPTGPAVATEPAPPGDVAAVEPLDPTVLGDRFVGPVGGARYAAPVPGAVLRGFEPAGSTFGAGHRGVDLAARAGEAVASSASGTVTFAGVVADRGWVSVQHPDGVVTSYGPLRALTVARGMSVTAGAALGELDVGGHGDGRRDDGLHWSARVAGRYVDPLLLLGGGAPRPSLVGEAGWEGRAHAVRPYEQWGSARAGGWLVENSPTAARPGFAVAPNPNHLVLIQGLASSSQGQLLDAAHLGYDDRGVTAFAYPRLDASDGDADEDWERYSAEDTWEGTGPAAARLAEQLRRQAAAEPGRAVDLVGHSMGGVVIWRYLVEHHDPYDPSLPPIGHIATIGSPLRGSDLAAAGQSLLRNEVLGPVLRDLQPRLGVADDQLPVDAPAIDELAVGSAALEELAVAWQVAVTDGAAGPLATGTRVLTIGGAKDPVVLADRARMPAVGDPETDLIWHPEITAANRRAEYREREFADDIDVELEHRVLPGGHHRVTQTEAVNQVLWRFLAGEQPAESPGRLSTVAGRELGAAGRVLAEAARWLVPVPSARMLGR